MCPLGITSQFLVVITAISLLCCVGCLITGLTAIWKYQANKDNQAVVGVISVIATALFFITTIVAVCHTVNHIERDAKIQRSK